MKNLFPIKEGSLEFIEDYIEIRDKWKSQRFFYYTLPIVSIPYPLMFVLRPPHDNRWWLMLVLLIVGSLLLLYMFLSPKKRIFKGQLPLNQIALVVLERYNYDKLSAKFILQDGKRRLVDLDFDRFWMADLKEVLEAKGIDVEIL